MTLVAASLEEKYFETRDNFIRQFEKSIDPDWMTAMKKDEHALAELEKQLKAIVGPVNVEGFPKKGKINLLTLQKDYGFGQVDGLRFSTKQEYLFVTTDNILKKYLAGQPTLPKDLAELSKTGEFYVRAITAESAVTYFAEIPVKSANEKSYVRAFLGLTAQDIGPFIVALVAFPTSHANAQSQAEMNRQTAKDFEKADADLNSTSGDTTIVSPSRINAGN